MSSTFDTLVVGAGPTGLTLAAELLRQGIPASQILLIDVLKEPLIQTKASVLWPRSLELLSNYEGVVEMGEAYGDKLTNVVLRAGKDNTLIAKINLARHFDSTFHHGLMLEQWYTEKIITAYLSKHGLSVTRSTALVSFVYTDHPLHPIEATLKTPNGNKTIRVKYIVGADGGRSGVRKQLGIEFKGETMQGTFFSAHFSVKKPLLDIDNTALSLFLRPSGMGFITPMPGGTYMSALDLQGQQCGPFLSNEKDARGFPLLKEIPLKEAEVILRERLSLHIEVDKMIWQTHFRIQERLVGKYGDGKRVFLAGDACHAHSPLGGQGQNTGIQDAVNLGWKLSSVLKGTLSPSLLATYEEERLAVGQHLIDFTMRGTKVRISASHPSLFS
ncbi:FAD-binding monooxygenase [Chytriomyces sp. MP71]|nr:FAD-binding monooxygenase [Chytriomyces sp. MP71]